jgi:hypothetical protein
MAQPFKKLCPCSSHSSGMAQPFKQNYIPVVHTLLAWHNHSNKIIFLQFTHFWHGTTIQTKLYSCSSHSSGTAQPFKQNYTFHFCSVSFSLLCTPASFCSICFK